MKGKLLLLQFTCIYAFRSTFDPSTIKFIVYPEKGNPTVIPGYTKKQLTPSGCSKDQKFAIIIHGWMETCKKEWNVMLRSKLCVARGGCIICIDYSSEAINLNYFYLLRLFYDIRDVIVGRLRQMDKEGFDFDKGYMFGFSFGGQLALESAIEFGKKRFKMIDVCEKAGPGFTMMNLRDPKLAAKNVQCIHTSLTLGEYTRNCHQNWAMGNCGLSQVAASLTPKGSHGLCPYFYTSAFDNEFQAVPRPYGCYAERNTKTWPQGYKMGYSEMKSSTVQGEFFAETLADEPYNVVRKRKI